MSEKQQPPLAPIKFYTVKDLAYLFLMDRRVLLRQLKIHEDEIGIRIGRSYNIRQVEIIFKLLGHPRVRIKIAEEGKQINKKTGPF